MARKQLIVDGKSLTLDKIELFLKRKSNSFAIK